MSKFATEKACAEALVEIALSKGYSISVDDGEDIAVSESSDQAAIVAALQSTDADTLQFTDTGDGREPTNVGWMTLIWGNAEDGSELIADHTDNDAMNELAALVYEE